MPNNLRKTTLYALLISILCSFHLEAQTINIGCKSAADMIGYDRKSWTCNQAQLSQGWLMDFPIPATPPEPCKVITGIDVTISFSGDPSGVDMAAPGCFGTWYTNFFVNCTGFGICACPSSPPDLLDEVPGQPTSQSFGNPSNAIQWGGTVSVDLVGVMNLPACAAVQDAITLGLITASFTVCVIVNYTDDLISQPIDLGPDLDVCFGQTTSLDASGPYDTWDWSTTETSMMINAGAGTYDVTVTDNLGCTDSDQIVVNEAPDINISFDRPDPFLICSGEMPDITATATGGSGSGYQYQWLTPLFNTSNTNVVTTDIIGTYNITVTDSDMCTKISSIEVNTNPNISISFDRPDPFTICDGQMMDITASASGGSGAGYQYQWMTPAGGMSAGNVVTTDIAGTYDITVTDGAMCSMISSITVSFSPSPTATIDAPSGTDLCIGSILDLNGIGAGGSGAGYSYQWTGPGFSSTDQNITITDAGTYTLIVTDGNSCESTPVDVMINGITPSNAGTSGVFEICTDQFFVNLPSLLGIHDPAGFWVDNNSSGVDLSDPTSVNISALTTGDYSFAYFVTATPPCPDDMATIFLEIQEAPDAGSANSLDLCTDQGPLNFYDLVGTSNFAGTWNPISAPANGVTINDHSTVDISTWTSGSYVFDYFITANFPCADDVSTLTLNIEAFPNAGESNGLDNEVCLGSTISLFDYLIGNPDAGGSWADDDLTGVDLTDPTAVDFTMVPEGSYCFTYTINGNLCLQDDDATVTIELTEVDAGISPDSLVCGSNLNLDLNDYVVGSPGGLFIGETMDTITDGLIDSIAAPGQNFNFQYVIEGSMLCPETRDTFEFNFIDSGDTTRINQALCNDDSFSVDVGPDTYDISNPVGVSVLADAMGCDSLVKVDLEFNQSSVPTMIEESRCKGDGYSITVGSETFDESNPMGSVTLQNQNSCDSLVEVNLIFQDALNEPFEVLRCKGDGYSVMVGSDVFDESNPTGSVTLMSTAGCDSIVAVNLIFQDAFNELIMMTRCVGDGFSLDVGSTTFDETNPNGMVSLMSSIGCDSIVEVQLVFNDTYDIDLSSEHCEGDGFSLVVGSTTFDQNNPTGSVILLTPAGCDSTVNVFLDFRQEYTTDLSMTRCKGDGFSVMVGNETFNEANPSGSVVLQSSQSCDSTVVVQLDFQDAFNTQVAMDQCKGDGSSIMVGAEVFDESNPTGTVILQSTTGCDSIIEVSLNYLDAFETNIEQFQCQNDGFSLQVGNTTFDESNPSGSVNLTTSMNCDSLVNVALIFNPTTSSSISETRCQGDGYTVTIGGDTYDEANPTGQSILAGANIFGCDSLVDVALDFSGSTIMSDIQLDRCETSGFEIQVGSDTYNINNPSGTTVIQTPGECDSIVMVDLSFITAVDSSLSLLLCDNESMVVAGQVIDINNTPAMLTLASADPAQCDTTLNLDIQFLDTDMTDVAVELCQGDSIFLEGSWQFADGFFTEQFLNQQGCDSIVNTDLGFMACAVLYDLVFENPLCADSNDGEIRLTITQAGFFPYSVVLSMNNMQVDNATLVSVGAEQIFDGLPFGEYQLEIFDQFGTSIAFEQVILDAPDPIVASAVIQDVSCFGLDDGAAVISVLGGTPGYNYSGANVANDQISSLQAGSFELTVTDQNNCQTILPITVDQPTEIQFDLEIVDPSCQNLNGFINIINPGGGTGPYSYSIDNNAPVSDPSFSDLGPGNYSVQVIDANNCMKGELGLILEDVNNLSLSLASEAVVTDSEGILLEPIIDFTPTMISWSPAEGLSCTDCLNPVANPDNITVYTVSLTDAEGCSVEASIAVRKELDVKVYIPNAFSPNGDGNNDTFQIGTNDVFLFDMIIYDRWGNKVFESLNALTDDESAYWDGRYEDTQVQPGVYLYQLFLDNGSGEKELYDGSITLIR